MTYDGWSKKSRVAIANVPGVADYQVCITVPYRAEMQADFDDLRLALPDGTALPYWIESKTDSVSAKVWTKVPQSCAAIWIYYGNGSATSESNAATVMDFFDDFASLGASGGVWTYSAGVTVANSILTVQATDITARYIYPTSYRPPNNSAVCWKVKNYHFSTTTSTGKTSEFILSQKGASPNPMIASFFSNGDVPNHGKRHKYHNGSTYTDIAALVNGTAGQWHLLEHHLLTDRLRVVLDGAAEVNTTTYNANGWSPIIEIAVVYAGARIDAECVYVRKVQTTEPVCTVEQPEPNPTPISAFVEWTKRSTLTVTNPPVDENFSHLVSIPKRAEMQADYDDLRFTLPDGTVVPHFIETYDGTAAWVWVKLPASCASYYLYYGNDAATSASDSQAVFLLYDDFSSGSVPDATKWTTSAGSPAVTGGELVCTNGTGDEIVATRLTVQGLVIGSRFKATSVGTNWVAVLAGSNCGIARNSTGNLAFVDAASGWGTIIEALALGTYVRYEVQYSSSVARARKILTTPTWSTWSHTASGTNLKAEVGASNANGSFDFVYARKYQAAEPSSAVGAAGANPNSLAVVTEATRSLSPTVTARAATAEHVEASRSLTPEAGVVLGKPELVEASRSLTGEAVVDIVTFHARATGSRSLTGEAVADVGTLHANVNAIRLLRAVGEWGSAVYPAWSTWAPVTVTNPPTSDGQVRLDLTLQDGMASDFRDIRFVTDADAALPYWIESVTGSSAVVWIRVPADTASFRCLWGNPAATDAGDGDAVMEFFDHFPGSSLDTATKWAYQSPRVTVADSIVTLGPGEATVTSRYAYGEGYAFRSKGDPGDAGNIDLGFFLSSPAGWCLFTGGSTYTYNGTSETKAGGSHIDAVREIRRRPGSVEFELNGTLVNTHTSTVPTGGLKVRLRHDPTGITSTYDWVAIRKLQTTEPVCTLGAALENGSAGVVVLGSYVRAVEAARLLSPEVAALSGLDESTDAARLLSPEVAALHQSAVLIEASRILDPLAIGGGEIELVTATRALAGIADALQHHAALSAAERSLSPEISVGQWYDITSEVSRALTATATATANYAILIEASRALAADAAGLANTPLLIEATRLLTPTPPRTVIFIDFSGMKVISSTTRRAITDAFWTLNETISGVETIPLDELRGAKLIAEDLFGTARCLFYGLLPAQTYQLAYLENQTSVIGYDYGWYLSQQYVPANRRIVDPTVNPTTLINEFLGGAAWDRVTNVLPHRVRTVTAYGTSALPAKQWEFNRRTTKMDAIRQLAEYCGYVFLVKWMQIGDVSTVDNPDPAKRLIRVEAEDYDAGGEGVGYHDVDTRNIGGAYRAGEGVDIEFFSTERGFNIGWIRDGEWLKYTRTFPWSGQYALQFRVACMGTLPWFDVYLNDVLQFRINVGRDYRTGSYSLFTNTDPAADGSYITVEAGVEYTIKIVFGGNSENVTPSNKHQNLARIDCIPQSGVAGSLDDARYQSVAYFVPETEIDSATNGLDLGAPVTISDPTQWPKSGSITIKENTGERYNTIHVAGHTASGVWFDYTARSAAVIAGDELPLEYYEESDKITDPATAQSYANTLLAYYQLDQRTYRMAFMQRIDLEPFQKIRILNHPKLPSAWCRITEVERRVDGKADQCTITIIPEATFTAQRKLQRMLFPNATSPIQAVVNKTIDLQLETIVVRCQNVDGVSGTFTVEGEDESTPITMRVGE